MSLADIARVAADECMRQKVGLDRFVSLLKAYRMARTMAAFGGPHESDVLGGGLAYIIEPSNQGAYRKTPVTFPDGGNAVHANNIPRAMMQWWAGIEAFSDLVGDATAPHVSNVADGLIKSFLDIHPFTDGNGRLAWLLRVWLLDQWDDPQPLPDYFGQY
jgi:hypothetical protein